jgi:hypothetical protein
MRLHDDVMRVLTIKVDEHEEGPSVQMQKRDDVGTAAAERRERDRLKRRRANPWLQNRFSAAARSAPSRATTRRRSTTRTPAAAALHLRARQDRAVPHHRRLGQEAARTGPRHQARPLPRPAALRREVRRPTCKWFFSNAWPSWARWATSSTSRTRLRAQLPAAAGQGADRDQGKHRPVRGAEGPARSAQPRNQGRSRGWPKRSTTAAVRRDSLRPPTAARSTAPSPPATRPTWRPRRASRSTASRSSSAPIKELGLHDGAGAPAPRGRR